MRTGELLEELRESILRDTSTIVSGPQDTLWSDESLMRYMNEAEQIFARKTLCLLDGTTDEITRITLVAGQAEYPLSPKVINVFSAGIEGEGKDMVRAGHELVDQRAGAQPLTTDIAFGDPVAPAKISECPTVYTTDEDSMTFRVYPEASDKCDGRIVRLRVARLPINDLTLNDLEARPEIREEYHLGMLDWAAYRALSNHDSDAEAGNRADKRKERFEDMVKEVKLDIRRRRFSPTAWKFGWGHQP